ncbi:MAG: hypothetical protein QNK37_27875, partial [Acidobacteriota bacterium]|nr:hypothetical protein [Acidobacteriota bacterium]
RKVRVKEPQLISFTLLFSAQKTSSHSLPLTFPGRGMRPDSLLLTFPGCGIRTESLTLNLSLQPMTTAINGLATPTDNQSSTRSIQAAGGETPWARTHPACSSLDGHVLGFD